MNQQIRQNIFYVLYFLNIWCMLYLLPLSIYFLFYQS